MTRSKRASLISLSMMSALMVVLTACSAASLSSNTTYTFGNASPAVLALDAGILQASTSAIPGVCFETGSLPTITFHFAGYYSASGFVTTPYTLTGSLVEVTSVSINGTVNFTGGVVTQIAYNNVVASPPSGTYQITFTGGAVYIYNLATGTFTLT